MNLKKEKKVVGVSDATHDPRSVRDEDEDAGVKSDAPGRSLNLNRARAHDPSPFSLLRFAHIPTEPPPSQSDFGGKLVLIHSDHLLPLVEAERRGRGPRSWFFPFSAPGAS